MEALEHAASRAKQRMAQLADDMAHVSLTGGSSSRAGTSTSAGECAVTVSSPAIKATVAHLSRLESTYIPHAGEAHDRSLQACRVAHYRGEIDVAESLDLARSSRSAVQLLSDSDALAKASTMLQSTTQSAQRGGLRARITYRDGAEGPIAEVRIEKEWSAIPENAIQLAEAMLHLEQEQAQWLAAVRSWRDTPRPPLHK